MFGSYCKGIKDIACQVKVSVLDKMVDCSMYVPLFIGEAHSIRFNNFTEGVNLLEKAMASCNKMVIYLEQILGLYGSKVNGDLVEDIIKRYTESRSKMFRLEKS